MVGRLVAFECCPLKGFLGQPGLRSTSLSEGRRAEDRACPSPSSLLRCWPVARFGARDGLPASVGEPDLPRPRPVRRCTQGSRACRRGSVLPPLGFRSCILPQRLKVYSAAPQVRLILPITRLEGQRETYSSFDASRGVISDLSTGFASVCRKEKRGRAPFPSLRGKRKSYGAGPRLRLPQRLLPNSWFSQYAAWLTWPSLPGRVTRVWLIRV